MVNNVKIGNHVKYIGGDFFTTVEICSTYVVTEVQYVTTDLIYVRCNSSKHGNILFKSSELSYYKLDLKHINYKFLND